MSSKSVPPVRELEKEHLLNKPPLVRPQNGKPANSANTRDTNPLAAAADVENSSSSSSSDLPILLAVTDADGVRGSAPNSGHVEHGNEAGGSGRPGESGPNGSPEEKGVSRGVRNLDVNLTRVWISCILVITTTIMGLVGASSDRVQYLNYRIGVDKYNYTGPGDPSANGTGHDDHEISVLVQSEVSFILIYLTLACDLPAMVTCLLVGSYSDFLGRRPILVMAVFGNLSRAGALAIVSHFHLPIQYLYLGEFIQGLTGSPYTVGLAMTATLVDITPEHSQRAPKFAILQAAMLIAVAVTQIGVGYSIAFWGYIIPAFVSFGLCVFSLLLAIVAVPETLVPVRKEFIDWNPLIHFQKVVGFYFSRSHGNKRALYITGLSIYLMGELVSDGRLSVTTMYYLAPPISWNSVDIGIYSAVCCIVLSLIAVVYLRIFRGRVALEFLGMGASFSFCASLVILGLADSGFWVYMSAVVGLLAYALYPIPKALLSLLTSPAEQGALFSSLAVINCLADMFSSTLCTVIYEQTLATFKGAVFIFLAGVTLSLIFLLGLFYGKRKQLSPNLWGEPQINEAKNRRSQEQKHSEDEKSPLLS